MPKILRICTPFQSTFQDCYKESLLKTLEYNFPGWSVSIKFNDDSFLPIARDRLIEDKKFHKALFIDSDMKWRPEDIQSLLEREELIVSAAWKIKRSSKWYGAGWESGRRASVHQTGYHQVDWVGAAFLMIDKEALQKPFPYFNALPGMRETFSFCRYVDQDIWVDFNTEVGHFPPLISAETEEFFSRLQYAVHKNQSK